LKQPAQADRSAIRLARDVQEARSDIAMGPARKYACASATERTPRSPMLLMNEGWFKSSITKGASVSSNRRSARR
jgi:hypothetical protein